jgi:hypothetical protein
VKVPQDFHWLALYNGMDENTAINADNRPPMDLIRDEKGRIQKGSKPPKSPGRPSNSFLQQEWLHVILTSITKKQMKDLLLVIYDDALKGDKYYRNMLINLCKGETKFGADAPKPPDAQQTLTQLRSLLD